MPLECEHDWHPTAMRCHNCNATTRAADSQGLVFIEYPSPLPDTSLPSSVAGAYAALEAAACPTAELIRDLAFSYNIGHFPLLAPAFVGFIDAPDVPPAIVYSLTAAVDVIRGATGCTSEEALEDLHYNFKSMPSDYPMFIELEKVPTIPELPP